MSNYQHMTSLKTCALMPLPRNAEDGWKAATDEMAIVATARDRSMVQDGENLSDNGLGNLAGPRRRPRAITDSDS